MEMFSMVGITLILAALVALLSLFAGIAIAWFRGPLAGFVTACVILMAGVAGYIGLVAAAASM